MTDNELEVLFRSWWSASYPGAPPGQHALATHLGWARFLLQRVQEQQQREVER
jgi:hypothetical protein